MTTEGADVLKASTTSNNTTFETDDEDEVGMEAEEVDAKGGTTSATAAKPKRTNKKRSKGGRVASDITREELASYFNMPSEEAAQKLGVGLTCLKRICRKHGVSRWPYRKLKSLDRLICHVETGAAPGDVNKQVAKTVDDIRQCKEQMISGGALEVDRGTRRLQQALSKMQHKMRKAAQSNGPRSSEVTGDEVQQRWRDDMEVDPEPCSSNNFPPHDPSHPNELAAQLSTQQQLESALSSQLPPAAAAQAAASQSQQTVTVTISRSQSQGAGRAAVAQAQAQQQQQAQQAGEGQEATTTGAPTPPISMATTAAAAAAALQHIPLWPSISHLQLLPTGDPSISLPPGGLLSFLDSTSFPLMLHSLPAQDLFTSVAAAPQYPPPATTAATAPAAPAPPVPTSAAPPPATSQPPAQQQHPSPPQPILASPPALHYLPRPQFFQPGDAAGPPAKRRKMSPFEAIQHAAAQKAPLTHVVHIQHAPPPGPPAYPAAPPPPSHANPYHPPPPHHHPQPHNPTAMQAPPPHSAALPQQDPRHAPPPHQHPVSSSAPDVALHPGAHAPQQLQQQPRPPSSSALVLESLPLGSFHSASLLCIHSPSHLLTHPHHPPPPAPGGPAASQHPSPPLSAQHTTSPPNAQHPAPAHCPPPSRSLSPAGPHPETRNPPPSSALPPQPPLEPAFKDTPPLSAGAAPPHHHHAAPPHPSAHPQQHTMLSNGAAPQDSHHHPADTTTAPNGPTANGGGPAWGGFLAAMEGSSGHGISSASLSSGAADNTANGSDPNNPNSGRNSPHQVEEAEAYAGLQYSALQLGRVMRSARLKPLGLPLSTPPGHRLCRDLLLTPELREEQVVAYLQLLAIDLGYVLLGIELTALPRTMPDTGAGGRQQQPPPQVPQLQQHSAYHAGTSNGGPPSSVR